MSGHFVGNRLGFAFQQRFEVMTIKQLRKRLEQLPVVRGVTDGPDRTLAA
jgi:hypothetical protein